MNIRVCIPFVLALPLVGCQTSGEVSEVERQAVILAAVPSNYRQVVPPFFRAAVPDPTGIQSADISTPLLGSSAAGVGTPLVCVRVQSAGGPGGAASSRTIGFVFDDGRVVDTQWSNPACATGTYSPFPELPAAYAAANATSIGSQPL